MGRCAPFVTGLPIQRGPSCCRSGITRSVGGRWPESPARLGGDVGLKLAVPCPSVVTGDLLSGAQRGAALTVMLGWRWLPA